jgi:hypothetical protein
MSAMKIEHSILTSWLSPHVVIDATGPRKLAQGEDVNRFPRKKATQGLG